jgi:hypothetical protein
VNSQSMGEGRVDEEAALRRQVESLRPRFPQVPRDELERRVRETYHRIDRDAHIHSHVLARTLAEVTEQLRREGVAVHVRGA